VSEDERWKYEIAFSFVEQDEGLATQLNDSLQDRFKTFLYTKEQKRLVGADGQDIFTRVFQSEARTVAVLYRPGWGESPWTRIEATAIRNRAYNDGFDFATFIIVEGDGPPLWLPKTRIWHSLERFGMDGAAAVLEARATELGSTQREEGLSDRAERMKRHMDLQAARLAFQKSTAGVEAAKAAHAQALECIKAGVEELHAAGVACKFHEWPQGYTGVTYGRTAMTIIWSYRYSNDLEEAKLRVAYYDGVPPVPGLRPFDVGSNLRSLEFEYQLAGQDRPRWVGNGREFSSEGLSTFLLKSFMDVHEKRN
jgi:hypothetical protein